MSSTPPVLENARCLKAMMQLSPPLPIPFPSLRSINPQIQLEGMEERCELPQRTPSRNRIWRMLALKCDMVAIILIIFPRINRPKFPRNLLIFVPPPRGFLWRILRRRGCRWTPWPGDAFTSCALTRYQHFSEWNYLTVVRSAASRVHLVKSVGVLNIVGLLCGNASGKAVINNVVDCRV